MTRKDKAALFGTWAITFTAGIAVGIYIALQAVGRLVVEVAR
jgi:hypothetical protein